MNPVSRVPVYAALIANIAIAIAKFVAALVTGSSVMFAEGIHSAVDSSTELLLLLGIKRSQKPADRDHPFGYGKEIYFWTLIVSIVTFALGSGVSILKGVNEFRHPQLGDNPVVNYAILGVAYLFEGASFYIALRNFPRKGHSLWEDLRLSKDPSLFAVIYEDGAALVGLTIALAGVLLSNIFHQPVYDAIASVLIGALLAFVSFIMARECRNLLVGESAHSEMVDNIYDLVNNDPDVFTLRHPVTMHLSPTEILLAIDVQFKRNISSQDLARIVERLENAIRIRFPEVKRIYMEARNLVRQ